MNDFLLFCLDPDFHQDMHKKVTPIYIGAGAKSQGSEKMAKNYFTSLNAANSPPSADRTTLRF
jgi:hypothetical protein